MTEEMIDQTNLDERMILSAVHNDPAPEYTATVKMKDHDMSQRFRWAKQDVHKLGEVLTMDDVERLFRMPKRGAQRLVQKYLMPLGAVVKVGRKYLVHTWGVRKLVGATDGQV